MATLTNPMSKSNIATRFADFTAASANGSIIWSSGTPPQYTDPADQSVHDVIPTAKLSGASGLTPGANLSFEASALITAQSVINALSIETQRFKSIREVKATLTVTGDGGNRPAGPVSGASGVVFDQTKVAHINAGATDPIGGAGDEIPGLPAGATYSIATGQKITSANVESFMTALKDAYIAHRDNELSYNTDICHASCHSSCHSSRSRR